MERSNIVGDEHKQGRLTVSLLDEAKKNIRTLSGGINHKHFQKKLNT